MLKKGFTLIELLIVIAVIGILAVAVIAAINPIEQVNRSADTGSLSDSEQLISAVDRYYAATNGVYPWQTEAGSAGIGIATLSPVDDTWVDNGNPAGKVLDKLSEGTGGSGELKQSYINKVKNAKNPLKVYHKADTAASTYVCFISLSKSFKTKASDRCTAGLPDDLNDIRTSLCGVGSASDYYTCLP